MAAVPVGVLVTRGDVEAKIRSGWRSSGRLAGVVRQLVLVKITRFAALTVHSDTSVLNGEAVCRHVVGIGGMRYVAAATAFQASSAYRSRVSVVGTPRPQNHG